MIRSLNAENQSALDGSLTQLLAGVHGGIDFWTVVCIGQIPPDPCAFVLKQSERLESFLAEARSLLLDGQTKLSDSNRQLLDSLGTSLKEFKDAFVLLARHRTVPVENVRTATEALSSAYQAIRETARELAEANGVRLSFWNSWTAERQQNYQGMLSTLFTEFCNNRTPKDIATHSTN